MKKLSELFCPYVFDPEYASAEISDVTDDSRCVTPGSMFIAVPGNACSGEMYVQEAVKKGAKVILLQKEKNGKLSEQCDGVIFLFTDDVRAEMPRAAGNFFESSFDNMAAVTGTNGKSSTADIFRQLMNLLNIPTASIGTLGVIAEGYTQRSEKHLTSPGSIELNKILHDLTGKVRSVVMEASSHGIEQRRMANLNFTVCGFTNFSEEHLDYHETMENYWHAKSLLFSELAPGTAKFVVNADCEKSEEIEKIAAARGIQCFSYGLNGRSFKIMDMVPSGTHQYVLFRYNERVYLYDLPLMGEFQVYNSLCALAMCHCCGAEVSDLVKIMPKLQPISGRLELVASINGTGKNASNIFVDYAHTPAALQSAVSALKQTGSVSAVFGCGGDREKQKRGIMGRIAQESADYVVVTDDNPRTEDPAEIRKSIMKECPKAKEIADRAEAICYAIDNLQPGCSLLIAGKGHEDYQIIGDKTIHFSDKEVVLEHIK